MRGPAPIAYRETITRQVEIDHTYKKIHGPRGTYARVKILFTPLANGTGFHFDNAAPHEAVPREYIPGFNNGIAAEKDCGVLGGFPLTDCRVTLQDGAYHDVDSSVSAFEHATREAFRQGIGKAGPILLEPVMKLELAAPPEFSSAIVQDIEQRRGTIENIAERSDAVVIAAAAPQATLLDYEAALAALSRGQATCTMTFSHYAPLPPDDDPPFAPARAGVVNGP